MPMLMTYSVVCDVCGNYAGWNPWPSSVEAITAARRLDWVVTLSENKTNSGQQTVHAVCANCKESRG
jgi:hypothetical protein